LTKETTFFRETGVTVKKPTVEQIMAQTEALERQAVEKHLTRAFKQNPQETGDTSEA